MAYTTQGEFEIYSPSTPTIEAAEFAELSERASDVIDMLTQQKIPLAGGIAEFSAYIQTQTKKATNAQIQFMYEQGGISSVLGQGGAVNSASIGKFSYGADSKDQVQMINNIPISPLVKSYLYATGLLYRGIAVVQVGENRLC